MGWLVLAAVVAYLVVKGNPAIVSGLSNSFASTGLSGVASSIAGTAQTTLAQTGVSYQEIGPNSNPSGWYKGITPGTVMLGGKPAPTGWSPNGDNDAASAANTTKTAAGIVGITAAAGATGIFGTSTISVAIGGAIPVIGVALAAGVAIMSIIAAHHAQALANEGKVLNNSDPLMLNAYVMILQAVLAGEMTADEVAGACTVVENDWYAQVKSIQRGSWPYTGQDLTADYNKVWIQRTQPPAGAPGFSDYHAPDPCNGACVIGHFFAERNKFLVEAACADALAGNHGILILPMVPAHDTQSGFPEVDVIY